MGVNVEMETEPETYMRVMQVKADTKLVRIIGGLIMGPKLMETI